MDRYLAAFVIVLLGFSYSLFATMQDIGVTYDEPAYFYKVLTLTNSSLSFTERFAAFIPPEHPQFAALFNTPFYLLTRSFLDKTTSLRIGTTFLYLLFLIGSFFLLRKLLDAPTALCTLLILMTMPRLFFHAHLLALDLPVMALYFLTVLLFYKTMQKRSQVLIVTTSIILAAIIATKITGYFIFIALLIYSLYYYIRYKQVPYVSAGRINVPILFIVYIIAGIIFLTASPQLYSNPLGFITYFQFNADRAGPVFLFGGLHDPWAPISYLYVPFALFTTFNAFHVIFAIIGMLFVLRNRQKKTFFMYLLIMFGSTLLFFMLPFVPKTDADRLFLVIYPFMALFGGIGFVEGVNILWSHMKKRWNKDVLVLIASVLLLAAGIYSVGSSHPFESSYFNVFVGGTEGVADSNLFMVTYWQGEFLYALDWLNSLPAGTTISAHPYDTPLRWYRAEKMLQQNLQIYSPTVDNVLNYGLVPLKQSALFYGDLTHPVTWGKYNRVPTVFSVRNKQGTELVRVINMTLLGYTPPKGN